MALQGIEIDRFLREYWQQRPLLMTAALPGFSSPLTPDELAGLACEPEIESRLITGAGRQFELEHGPLPEERFAQLPEHDWTLLVQSVDQWVPAVADLLRHFDFLPRWRIDDIMVSYAAEGGSVGPHYDNYDVFLLQAAGTREWRLGQWCDDHSPLLAHDSLRLLAEFDQQQALCLQAGDVLYLPPQLAHWGVALDSDCMTYSIGFRAPSHAEIIAECCDEALARLADTQRYRDPRLGADAPTHEISPAAIDAVCDILASSLLRREHVAAAFARLVTRAAHGAPPDDVDPVARDPRTLAQALRNGLTWTRDPAARLAYVVNSDNIDIYVNGESRVVEKTLLPLVKVVSDSPFIGIDQLLGYLDDLKAMQLLVTLEQEGLLCRDD